MRTDGVSETGVEGGAVIFTGIEPLRHVAWGAEDTAPYGLHKNKHLPLQNG